MVRQYRNGTETRMDYEQYLYGRTARDASHRATQVSHHGRIGSLAFGGALALGIVAVIAVFGGTIGEDAANAAKLRSIAIYDYGRIVAEERGIIIADTKFEFGIWNEEVILIDECMTPDSSRFWPLAGYAPGGPQPSFDKQPVRDWMVASGWKDGDAAPVLPADVAAATTERYLTAYRMLTGQELPS